MTAQMSIWRGFSRETEIVVDVELLDCGAGLIVCPECGGDGDWRKFHPEPELHPEGFACVECKGTGRVLVSIAQEAPLAEFSNPGGYR
jgi:hypothetical protein